jgi:hypothetical protein
MKRRRRITLNDKLNGWRDPFPDPVVEEHEGILVVRDDLLGGGSKMRFADHLIASHEEIKEWVYGSSSATGYAQISLARLCTMHGKKTVLFMADRAVENRHEYQLRAIQEGADIRWIPNGMLNVTEARARDYVIDDPLTRKLLPIGLDHPVVIAAIEHVAKGIDVVPEEVWTVGSSGTLTRGLQKAWPDADFHCVTVGHWGKYGRAKIHKCDIPFAKPARVMPPFPSAPSYDAKAWEFIKQHASEGALFWNVGA